MHETQTIRGYIQALPTVNGKEDAPRVAVVTDDGKEYQVVHKGEGVRLLSDINANVEVTGLVVVCPDDQDIHAPDAATGDDDAFCYRITVKQYRLTDGFDDPWYDDTV